MKKTVYRSGMTLVEIVMVVSIIGLLATFLVPAVAQAMKDRENARAASKLRQAVTAFNLYKSETGSYPADKTPGVIPPEMVDYFADMGITAWWSQKTEIGGNWDWDKGYHFAYSVSIARPARSVKQLQRFDALVDDGNLATGKFRAVGSQYHFIIEE